MLLNIEEVLPDLCSDKDLLYMGSNVSKIRVHVLDKIYKLIGEIISSSSDGDSQMDIPLENYLTNNVETLDSQRMARMKQTVRKQNTVSSRPPPAVANPSNKFDSDSSLERAFNAINNDNPDMASKGPRAASHSSPRWGGSSSLHPGGGGAGGQGGTGGSGGASRG